MTEPSDRNPRAAEHADSGASVDRESGEDANVSREASEAEGTVVVSGTGIDIELEEEVKEHVEHVRVAHKRTVEEAWELGRALRQAKKQVRHGQWTPWIEEQIGLPVRTAQRLMELHRKNPEKRHVAHLPSVRAAMKALAPVFEPADENKPADTASDEATSMGSEAETTGAAESAQESSGEVGHVSADAGETTLVAATPETSSAKRQESVGEAELATGNPDDASSAEVTTETTRLAPPAPKCVEEIQRGSTGGDETSYVVTREMAGAAPLAEVEARSDGTLKTTGEDLPTVVAVLELVLEGTPASAPLQREADLRALSKAMRVLVKAILRHMDQPASGSQNAGEFPHELIEELSEAMEPIKQRRQSRTGSMWNAMRRGWRTS